MVLINALKQIGKTKYVARLKLKTKFVSFKLCERGRGNALDEKKELLSELEGGQSISGLQDQMSRLLQNILISINKRLARSTTLAGQWVVCLSPLSSCYI